MNMKRFREVLAYIEAHPEEWDQDFWQKAHSPCGTACCIAGHAEIMAGFIPDQFARTETIARAQGWLDLTFHERCWLFCYERTLDDFRTVARRVYA